MVSSANRLISRTKKSFPVGTNFPIPVPQRFSPWTLIILAIFALTASFVEGMRRKNSGGKKATKGVKIKSHLEKQSQKQQSKKIKSQKQESKIKVKSDKFKGGVKDKLNLSGEKLKLSVPVAHSVPVLQEKLSTAQDEKKVPEPTDVPKEKDESEEEPKKLLDILSRDVILPELKIKQTNVKHVLQKLKKLKILRAENENNKNKKLIQKLTHDLVLLTRDSTKTPTLASQQQTSQQPLSLSSRELTSLSEERLEILAIVQDKYLSDSPLFNVSKNACWVGQFSMDVCCRGDASTTPGCWDEHITFDECCPNSDCWEGGFTYGMC